MPSRTDRPEPRKRRTFGAGRPDDLDLLASEHDSAEAVDNTDDSLAGGLVEFFTDLRRKRRWSQTELAQRIHTTQSSVSEFENGQSEPRLSTLQRYATAAGYILEVRVLDGQEPVYTTKSHRGPELATETAEVTVDNGIMDKWARSPDPGVADQGMTMGAVLVTSDSTGIQQISVRDAGEPRPFFPGLGGDLAPAT
jgi:transcriptional regulator with XRE-family HTH domain